MVLMNKKTQFITICFLLAVLWFTLVSSFIDLFRISYGIIDMREVYNSIELSNSLLFFNLTQGIRLEGIQIAIAGGFLLVYFSKKRR